MAKAHYTADSASPPLPHLVLVQRRPEVTGSSPVSTSCDGITCAGTTFPTPRSSIV
jgi:hypothetical protein